MFWSPRISTKHLAGLCRRVGVALEAGIDARKTWAREAERARGRLRTELERIGDAIDRGQSLAEALSTTGHYFPDLVWEMVRVGEESGTLDQVLLRLADHYDLQLSLRRTFLIGIAWPMTQLGAAIFVIGLMIWILGIVGSSTGEEVDVLGWGLIGNRGLAIYAALVATAAGLVFLAIRMISRGWLWTAPLQRAVLFVPSLGGSLRTLSLSRMSWSLAMTMDTGMDVRRAVRLAVRSTRNAYYIDHTDRIDRVLAGGGQIHEALRGTGAYPDEFLATLEVGEESGRLPESMSKLSSQYQEQAKAALGTLSMIAAFATWGLVALLIISIIVRILIFIVGVYSDALEGI